jgi:hypothetical protein
MMGPPGAGKTLLARALPGILPKMSIDEALDMTRIYSVADQLPPETPLLRNRPFRSPHHTISNAGLFSGHFQAFSAPQAFHPLVVYSPAFVLQQGCNATIAIPSILASQFHHTKRQAIFIVRFLFEVSLCGSRLSESPAHTPL